MSCDSHRLIATSLLAQCFQPPFTVDVNNFRFTPRIQRLNELEAQTRVRLSFLEKLIKWWELQGHQIKIPQIEKKILDLYQLHKVVEREGGFETCVKDRKWSVVAAKMGFQSCTPQNKGTIASLLRHHYEKLLFPYDLFANGATYDENSLEELKDSLNGSCRDNGDEPNGQADNRSEEVKIKSESNELEQQAANGESSDTKMEVDSEERCDNKPAARRTSSRRLQGQSLCNVKVQNNKELARLQVYGPGPKMPGFSSDSDEQSPDKHFNSSLPVSAVSFGVKTIPINLVILPVSSL